MPTPGTTSSSDTVQDQLRGLAPEAAMYVRDVIRGLEAEAGTARAVSRRAELAAARAEERADRAAERQAAAEAERDEALESARTLAVEAEALRRRVEELEHRWLHLPGRTRR